MSKFVNLHVHSTKGSHLDGLSKVEHIAKKCKELAMPGCAITEHGTLFSAPSFIKEMKKLNLKPIIGQEFYINPNPDVQTATNRKLSHLPILAKNLDGWKALIKATSLANTKEQFYYKPRVSIEQIANFGKGNLIAFSGHPGSDLANILFTSFDVYRANSKEEAEFYLKDDWEKQAGKLADKYRQVFGKDNFYLEIQLVDAENMPASIVIAECLRKISKTHQLQRLATCDSHYIDKEDAKDQRLLLAIAMNTPLPYIHKRLDEGENVEFGGFFKSNNYHFAQYEDLMNLNDEEEIKNTLKVFEQCESYNIFRNPILPKFDCPNNMSEIDYLKELCQKGLIDRGFGQNVPTDYSTRLKTELDVIELANLSGYFLIVQDFCKYADNNNILRGIARGSAGGCLLSYLLKITELDPIPYGLMFERFYNAGRISKDKISLPDIDCDFPKSKRKQIIEYIVNKYGSDKVSNVATFSRLQGRGAMKDVLRMNDAASFDLINKITKNIPDEAKIADDLQHMKEEYGESGIIRWCLENEPKKFKEWCKLDKEQKEDGEIRCTGPLAKYFEQAMRIENCYRQTGKHASGIAICGEPLNDICPMLYDSKTKNQLVGLEYEDAEQLGINKLDVLGLSSIDKITGCIKLIRGHDIDNE